MSLRDAKRVQRSTLGVLITYFNERQLLRACLDSLLGQSEGPDEILIYDDASDFPPEPYVPAKCAVRVIKGTINVGPSAGRNILLRHSTSDYVHFHDADDTFYPDWCVRIRQAIAGGVDAIFTEISVRSSEKVADRVIGLYGLRDGRDLVRFCLRGVILTSAGTYRRTTVETLGGYCEDLRYAEDFEFHVRLAAIPAIRYAVIDDPLVVRTRGSQSHAGTVAWSSAVKAIASLASDLAPAYRSDLAEAAVRAGLWLFRKGALADARAAFRLGQRLGATYSQQRCIFRIVANLLGPEVAARTGIIYRARVSQALRRKLSEWGLVR